MANEFATQQPTTQDSETILWKKFSDWLYVYSQSNGIAEPEPTNDSQNVTMLIRSAAYNAYSLTQN